MTRRALVVTGVVLGSLLLVLVVWNAVEVLLLMFAGALVAVVLRFLSTSISRRTPLGEGLSLSLVLALLVALTTWGLWLAGPGLVAEAQALSNGMAESLQDLEEILRRFTIGAYALDSLLRLELDDMGGAMWARLGGFGATVFGATGAVFITLFVGIFFAYKPRLYLDGMLRLVPLPRRERACQVLVEIGSTLRGWLVGQLISMVLLWLSTWLLLHLLGVPLAFILGLLTGLLTFIPYLGPLIAAVPIAAVAFTVSPSLGAITLGAYFIIQNIEANIIMPIVFEKTVRIPPALSVASQLLMASLVGLPGILLATPLLAVAMVLVRMLYVEDGLGDDLDRPVEQDPGDTH